METLECVMLVECPIISEGAEREFDFNDFGDLSLLGMDVSDSTDSTGGGDDVEDAPVC